MIPDNSPEASALSKTQSKREVTKKTPKVWNVISWILLLLALIPIAGVVLIVCMFSMDHLERTDSPLTPAEANAAY